MDDRIIQRTEAAFEAIYGFTFAAVLAPIDSAMPAGKSLARGAVYHAIAQARREDDASLPIGSWAHERKRADWDRVATLALEALQYQSKDLQLAAWALEAGIHRHGFAALGAGLHLLQCLCARFWDDIHPQSQQGDMAYRANLFAWIDEKLLPAARQVALAHGREAQAYALADWELARRRTSLPAQAAHAIDGPGAEELAAALAAVPQERCAGMAQDLADAASLLDGLADTLAGLAGAAAPRFPHLARVLQQARGIVDGELQRRSAPPAPAQSAAAIRPAILHHLSLGVRDLQAAAAFHDAALGALGWRRVFEDDEAIGYGIEDGEDLLCLKLRAGATPPGPGFHLALGVPVRGAVDAFHAAGVAAGGRDAGPPGLRDGYGPAYYAAFLVDPDGHRIEAVAKGPADS